VGGKGYSWERGLYAAPMTAEAELMPSLKPYRYVMAFGVYL
jgi:hypothetical protein